MVEAFLRAMAQALAQAGIPAEVADGETLKVLGVEFSAHMSRNRVAFLGRRYLITSAVQMQRAADSLLRVLPDAIRDASAEERRKANHAIVAKLRKAKTYNTWQAVGKCVHATVDAEQVQVMYNGEKHWQAALLLLLLSSGKLFELIEQPMFRKLFEAASEDGEPIGLLADYLEADLGMTGDAVELLKRHL